MHGNMQKHARVAQLVERDLAKVEAAGSSPVSRSFCLNKQNFFHRIIIKIQKRNVLFLLSIEYVSFFFLSGSQYGTHHIITI